MSGLEIKGRLSPSMYSHFKELHDHIKIRKDSSTSPPIHWLEERWLNWNYTEDTTPVEPHQNLLSLSCKVPGGCGRMWDRWSATNPGPCQYFGKFSSARELGGGVRSHRTRAPAFHLTQTAVVGQARAWGAPVLNHRCQAWQIMRAAPRESPQQISKKNPAESPDISQRRHVGRVEQNVIK